MRGKIVKGLAAGLLVLGWLVSSPVCQGEEFADFTDSISLQEAEEAFQKLQGDAGSFSLWEYVTDAASGETDFSLSGLFEQCAEYGADVLEEQKETLLRILALGLLAGIFVNFSDTVGEKNMGETGFYITYTLLFATVAVGFASVLSVARESLLDLLAFMKALVPSFSLALCLGGGTGSAAAWYETMLIAMALIESLMIYVFLPGVQIYFMFGMMNPLAGYHFTRVTELAGSLLRGGAKLLFGVLLGYQGIQGLLLPVMDKVKQNTLLNTARGIPGVGDTVRSVADTVFGSSLLIRSAVGTGGLICILILCLRPLIKLLLFALVYKLGGALVQPVSDNRMTSALTTAAESAKLLAGYVFAGALMFLLSITIALAAVNFV